MRASRISLILTVVLAAALAGLTLYRTVTASFTHDESFTWNHYVTAPLADVLAYKVVSPNNHLLNTLLMKVTAGIFGMQEWALRLPNWLAHIGFMFFTFLLLRHVRPWLMPALFILVNANPYMLDFFSLARGNGLSLFFMAGSIWFLLAFFRNGKIRWYGFSTGMAVAGVLSHFTLVYFFLSLMTVAHLQPWLKKYSGEISGFATAKGMMRTGVVNLAAIVAVALFMTVPMIRIIRAGQLFYGGETGFWHDTVGTLVETFLCGIHQHTPAAIMLKGLVVITCGAVALLFVLFLTRKNRKTWSETEALFVIFLLMIIAAWISIAQFHLTGTRLMIRRYGLMFAPLFMLCLALLIDRLTRRNRRSVFAGLPAALLAAVFAIHTGMAFSSGTYLDWPYERDTKKAMIILSEAMQRHPADQPVAMGITWLYEPTVNFYRQSPGLNGLLPVSRDGPGIEARYYYILREDLPLIPATGRPAEILFHNGKSILIRR